MSWDPPVEVGEYRLVRSLGAGAMGQVFLAHDTVLDRAVAIKFISAIEVGAVARERFFTEARAVARLSHPNVVGIYRAGEIRERPYLVSEYVAGTTLAAIAKPVPWGRALAIGQGLARGLASAHRNGVLHRDIKPANVMLGEGDAAKLLDFGLAKLIEDADDRVARMAPLAPDRSVDATVSLADAAPAPGARGLTVDGVIVGTPLYLAPELWSGRAATPRSDVYSLGVVIYELLTGEAPHARTDLDELSRRAREDDAAPIAARVKDLPARFAEIVDACVSRDPEQRPASGEVLVEMLASVTLRSPSVADNPYRGLQAFDAAHRDRFFGRGEEARAVVERLRADKVVIVAGDSGAGKSSLCRAAVVPAFIEDMFEGRRWRAVTVVPGLHPVLPDLSDEGLLLFVDQLEELVAISDPEEAAAFATRLAALVGAPHVRLLASARSDFLGRLAALPGLGALLERALFLLGPLGERGLREAIVGPARGHGYAFETEATVDELVASGRRTLPLLQFTLAQLWEQRDDGAHLIPADALARIGGVAGALARHADQVMATLSDEERATALQVVVRLMTSEGTRAVVPRSEFSDRVRIVERLLAARLIVATSDREDCVEVVHEALFTGWPRLVAWRRAHESDTRMRDQVAEAARRWRERGEPRGLLWRGDALAEYRAWRRRWAEPLADVERRFGQASEVEAGRVWRLRVGALALVISGLVLASTLLYRADRRAESARAIAEAQNRALLVRHGQQELEAGYGGRALAYFVEALALGSDTPALRYLIARASWSAQRERGVIANEPIGHSSLAVSDDGAHIATCERGGTLRVYGADHALLFEDRTGLDAITQLTFAPDGRTLVGIGTDWTVRVWDLTTRERRALAVPRPPGLPAQMRELVDQLTFDLAISRDGRRVAIVMHVEPLPRRLAPIVLDLATGAHLATLDPGPDDAVRPIYHYRCAGFTPDGVHALAGTIDGAVAVWNVEQRRITATLRTGRGPCRIRVSPDGQLTYISAGAKVFVWHALEGPARELVGHAGEITSLDLSRDGRELLTASADGTAKRWDARTGELLGELAPSPRRDLTRAWFSPRRDRVVTVGADNLVRAWDVASSRQLMVIEPSAAAGTFHHTPAGAHDARFSRDGTRIVTASGVDVVEWDVGVESLIAQLQYDQTNSARFAPGDRLLAIVGKTRAVIREGDRVRTSFPLAAQAWELAWSPDGSRLAIAGDHPVVDLRDRDGAEMGSLIGHRSTISDVVYSHDGAYIATAAHDRTARIWDAATGKELRRFATSASAMSVSWSPDDSRVATSDYRGQLRIWDVATGIPIMIFGDPSAQFLDSAFSPDCTRLAVAGHDGVVSLWDVATGTRLRTLVGHTLVVTSVAWSPDGGLLATSGDEGGVRVWDPDTGSLLALFATTQREVMSVAWSHDGERLVSAGADGRVELWDARRDTRPLDQLRAFLAARVRWRLVDQQLVTR